MSSLHQDRSLVEGSMPVEGSARQPAEGTPQIPTQRSGKAQRQGTAAQPASAEAPAATTRIRRAATAKTAAAGAGALAAKAKAARTATTKVATKAAAKAATSNAAATAKAATRKAATVGTATARAATARAASATKAAAAARAANRATAVRSAKPVAAVEPGTPAKAPAAKPFPTPEATSTAPRPAGTLTATRRPTPYVRTPDAAPIVVVKEVPSAPAPVESAPAPVEAAIGATVEATVTPVEVGPAAVVPAVPEAGPARSVRSRPTWLRRRPELYLAAALVAALGVSVLAAEEPAARAGTTTVSASVSVAEQLGLTAEHADRSITAADTLRLEELAASRKERDADQAAAASVQAKADRKAAAAVAAAAAEAARPDAVLPVKGGRFTSGFGGRWGRMHAGIDLAAPMLTPEYSVMDGIVLEAGPSSGYGNAIYIQHHNGDVTVYGHMEKILVKAGQVVRAGDTIALLGNRGRSTGPHLHFEVHVGGLNGTKIDPVPWLRARGINV